MTVRRADSTDLPRIVEIHNQAILSHATAYLEPLELTARRAWFEGHDPQRYPIFVSETDGEVAGWCSLSEYRSGRGAVAQTTEISYFVHEDHRRRGHAKRLIDHGLAQCPALGLRTVIAILLGNNTGSVRLLEKAGFERWGLLPAVARFEERDVDHLYYGRHVK